jgi:predicted lipid carrier protein YhbT
MDNQQTEPEETTPSGLPDSVSDSQEYFNEFLPRLIREKQDITIGSTNFTCMFRIAGEKGGSWIFEIANGKIKPPVPTEQAQAPCVISMDDSMMMQIITGKVQPAHAFFRGHVKVKGGMQMLVKLTTLLPVYFRKHTLRAKK